MSTNKEFITVYSAQVRGVFGRNRSVKFESTNFCTSQVNALAALHNAVGPIKHGQVRVVEYANTEVSDIGSFIVPITQGVIVHSEEVTSAS